MSSQFELDTWKVAGSGHWFIAVAGEAITDRDAVRIGANGLIYRTDADAVATMPCMGIAITAGGAGQNISVFIQGPVEIPGSAWTLGGRIYVSTTTGGLTQTAPVAFGDSVQDVGFALNATQIYFNPQGDWELGALAGCPILEGATAYAGEDSCKAPYTNYFYTGDYATHTLLLAAAIDYIGTLGGGTLSLEAMTFDGRLIVDETEVLVFGQGWDTVIQQTADAGHAIVVSGVRCGVKDLHCLTEATGTNPYDAINITGEDCIVDNVFVSESDRHGILLNAPRGRITNCYLFNIDDNGVSIGALGDSSDISNNIINTTGADGILIDADGENCVVEGNFITTWTGEAIDDNSGTASIGDDNWAGAGSYETQAGIIAVPTVTAGGAWQGRTIEVYNSTEERYFAWTYNDGGFRGVEYL